MSQVNITIFIDLMLRLGIGCYSMLWLFQLAWMWSEAPDDKR